MTHDPIPEASIPVDWRDLAECRTPGIDFYPHAAPGNSNRDVWANAREVCSACQVRTDCLTYALDNVEVHGMWGGMTPDEREMVRRRQR